MKLTTCWKHENLFLDAWERVQFAMPRPWNSRAPYTDLTKSIYTILLHPIPSYFLRQILCLEGFCMVNPDATIWMTMHPLRSRKVLMRPKDGKSKPAKMCPAPSHCCQGVVFLWSSGSERVKVTSVAGPKELVGAVYSCNIICSFMGWSCIIHMFSRGSSLMHPPSSQVTCSFSDVVTPRPLDTGRIH